MAGLGLMGAVGIMGYYEEIGGIRIKLTGMGQYGVMRLWDYRGLLI